VQVQVPVPEHEVQVQVQEVQVPVHNRTKLHNLEHFTKILGFAEKHRVKVKHTQQLVLDST